MNVNIPLHGYVHLWMIGTVVLAGFLVIAGNKIYAVRYRKKERVTNVILCGILILYWAGYSYLCFFYRTPMDEPHLRLDPLWSYREAFGSEGIVRLGVARSIVLNILFTVPLGYLLPAVFRKSAHRYRKTILIIMCVSVGTEVSQYISKTGLCEIDDIFNNVLGGVIGLTSYLVADQII